MKANSKRKVFGDAVDLLICLQNSNVWIWEKDLEDLSASIVWIILCRIG